VKKLIIILLILTPLVNSQLAGSTVSNSYITFTSNGNENFCIKTCHNYGCQTWNRTIILNATNDYRIDVIPCKFEFSYNYLNSKLEIILLAFISIFGGLFLMIGIYKTVLPYLKWD
jgi:hypothetical protein